MNRKNILSKATLIGALSLSCVAGHAQDIHFTQFEAAPLTINPAFTGDFDGRFRAAGIYRNQWQSVTVPFVTYSASFDMPIVHDITVDDYLAAGLELYNDRAGDGNLSNTSALLSVAYHKFLGINAEKSKSISVGFQGGYTQKSIDISKLYFGDEFVNGYFQHGISQEYPFLNNSVHYFTINAGIGYAQSISQNFGFQLGVGANNLNQPTDALEQKRNSQVGLAMRYTGQLGAIINVSEKFSLRPGFLYQTQATANELVAGNEFNFIVGNPEIKEVATRVFLGAYYRTSDAAMGTIGFEYKGFRVGLSYDYNVSALKDALQGRGGFEISLRYIAPDPLAFAHRLVYPCSRF